MGFFIVIIVVVFVLVIVVALCCARVSVYFESLLSHKIRRSDTKMILRLSDLVIWNCRHFSIFGGLKMENTEIGWAPVT